MTLNDFLRKEGYEKFEGTIKWAQETTWVHFDGSEVDGILEGEISMPSKEVSFVFFWYGEGESFDPGEAHEMDWNGAWVVSASPDTKLIYVADK